MAIGNPIARTASRSVLPAGTSTERPHARTQGMSRRVAPLPGSTPLFYLQAMPSAGILIIGNEILSGKVVDANSPYLCRELRALGVDVIRVVVIPDEIETIARDVRAMSDLYDYVFTSGGVGPTHDDLTMEGVAEAFSVEIEQNESIAGRIERAQGAVPNESQLKMARIPAGAKLIDSGDLWFPLVVFRNVYIFPGIPELLRKKFESIRTQLQGVPFLLKRVFVTQRESDIAADLHDLLGEFPELLLGSYPRVGVEDFKVMLTLESREAGYLQRALDSLLARLPAGSIHKVE
jgi:FAD synthetase